MTLRNYSNAPATTLSASCSNSSTVIAVASVVGLPVSFPYVLILDRGTSTEEVVLVTNGAGTSLTVTRGYDSTTAFAHSSGAVVAHGISAIEPREANAHVNASNNVHGVSTVVGLTETQTLTNKTLTAPVLTLPTISSFAAAQHTHTNAGGGGQISDAALNAAVTIPKGGTGVASLPTGILVGAGTGAITAKTAPTGAVVGDSDTQTLTSKTLVGPIISNPIISGVGSKAFVYKSSTTSVSSGTDPITDSSLNFTVLANAVYQVKFVGVWAFTGGTCGLQIALVPPSGTITPDEADWATTTPAVSSTGMSQANVIFLLRVGGTGGTVTFQWGRVSSVGAVALQADSFLEITQVG